MKILDKPDCPVHGKWKMQLASMKVGDHFAAPLIKEAAIRRAAWTMKKRVEMHKMLVIWMVGKQKEE